MTDVQSSRHEAIADELRRDSRLPGFVACIVYGWSIETFLCMLTSILSWASNSTRSLREWQITDRGFGKALLIGDKSFGRSDD